MSRLPPGGGGKLFSAALCVLGAIAVVIFAIANAGNAVSQSAEVTANVAAGLFALFLLFLAYVLYRRVYPPSARHLKVTVSHPEVRRGGAIDARLELGRTHDADEPVQIGLVCKEFYDVEKTNYSSSGSGRYRDTEEATAYEDWRPASPSQAIQNVRFQVPADGPFSFHGDCLSFEWRVSARQPKRMRFDRATNVRVRVLP